MQATSQLDQNITRTSASASDKRLDDIGAPGAQFEATTLPALSFDFAGVGTYSPSIDITRRHLREAGRVHGTACR